VHVVKDAEQPDLGLVEALDRLRAPPGSVHAQPAEDPLRAAGE
jgi:hypothetical protein